MIDIPKQSYFEKEVLSRITDQDGRKCAYEWYCLIMERHTSSVDTRGLQQEHFTAWIEGGQNGKIKRRRGRSALSNACEDVENLITATLTSAPVHSYMPRVDQTSLTRWMKKFGNAPGSTPFKEATSLFERSISSFAPDFSMDGRYAFQIADGSHELINAESRRLTVANRKAIGDRFPKALQREFRAWIATKLVVAKAPLEVYQSVYNDSDKTLLLFNTEPYIGYLRHKFDIPAAVEDSGVVSEVLRIKKLINGFHFVVGSRVEVKCHMFGEVVWVAGKVSGIAAVNDKSVFNVKLTGVLSVELDLTKEIPGLQILKKADKSVELLVQFTVRCMHFCADLHKHIATERQMWLRGNATLRKSGSYDIVFASGALNTTACLQFCSSIFMFYITRTLNSLYSPAFRSSRGGKCSLQPDQAAKAVSCPQSRQRD